MTIKQILDEMEQIDFSEFTYERDMVKYIMMSREKIKSFLSTKLTELLNEIEGEIGKIQDYENNPRRFLTTAKSIIERYK